MCCVYHLCLSFQQSVRERESDRERDIERDRETERDERDRETERQRDRGRERLPTFKPDSSQNGSKATNKQQFLAAFLNCIIGKNVNSEDLNR